MMAGLEEVSRGTISIDGKVVNDVEPKDRDLAMVFQNYALYPHMTVYENMAFGLRISRVDKALIRQRVEEAAGILQIGELLDRKPRALSGGERQRVALGRAIVRKPKVFLFDEPLSNLDAPMRVQIRAEILKLHARLRATMIYVTHDQVEAMTMGDRIAVLKEGMVQQVADPITLYNSPKNLFVAGFIGSPAMNFLEGSILKEGDELFFHRQSVRSAAGPRRFLVPIHKAHLPRLLSWGGKSVVLGLRPEDIIVHDDATGAMQERPGLKAEVEILQNLGSESYLLLAVATDSLIARVRPQHQLKLHQSISLVFDMSKAHYFDPLTKQAIS